jgi:hypothetical protein
VIAAILASGLVAVTAVVASAPLARAATTGQDCNLPHDTTWGSTCDAYWEGHRVGTLTADKYNPQVGERVRLTVRVEYPPVQLLLWEFDPLDSITHIVGNNVGTNNIVLRFPGGKLVDWGQPPSAVRSDQVQNLSYISWSMNLDYNNCATAGTLVAFPERPACGIERDPLQLVGGDHGGREAVRRRTHGDGVVLGQHPRAGSRRSLSRAVRDHSLLHALPLSGAGSHLHVLAAGG